VPILEDAPVSLECRLVKTVEVGDHVLVARASFYQKPCAKGCATIGLNTSFCSGA